MSADTYPLPTPTMSGAELDELRRVVSHHGKDSYNVTTALLAGILTELRCWRLGGVTEAMLRAQDGCIHIGRGCVIVSEEQFTAVFEPTESVNGASPLHETDGEAREGTRWASTLFSEDSRGGGNSIQPTTTNQQERA